MPALVLPALVLIAPPPAQPAPIGHAPVGHSPIGYAPATYTPGNADCPPTQRLDYRPVAAMLVPAAQARCPAGDRRPSAPALAYAPVADADTVRPLSPTADDPGLVLPRPRHTLPGRGTAAPSDPLERVNRRIYAFNTGMDRHVLAPVAHAYGRTVPAPVRLHISLMLANLGEPATAANALLQGRLGTMRRTVARFALNSTLGVAGLFDVAEPLGLPRERADFGQTLARYGVRPGPYLMLPVTGPTDLRDGVGQMVDGLIDPVSLALGGLAPEVGLARSGAGMIDNRLDADPQVRAVADALDPYAATRSGFAQERAATVREATGEAEILPDFDSL